MDVDSKVLNGDLLPPSTIDEKKEEELLFEESNEDCLLDCSTNHENLASISFEESQPRLNWTTAEGQELTPPPPRTPENQPIPSVQPVAPTKKNRHSPPPPKPRRSVTPVLKSTVSVFRPIKEEVAEDRYRRRERRDYEDRVRRHHVVAETQRTFYRHCGRPSKGPATQPSKPFPEGGPSSYPPGVVGGVFRQARNRCTDKFQRVYNPWKKGRHRLSFGSSSGRTVSL